MRLHGERSGVTHRASWRVLMVGALTLALAGGTVSAEGASPGLSASPRGSAESAPRSDAVPSRAASAGPAPVRALPQPGAADAATAPTTSNAVYAYDAGGRLVGVTDPAGETARYRYDAAGNRLGIDRFPSTQLSALSVVPLRAAAGAKVTLSGTGFSATAASNAVSFAGVSATVVSATTTRLVVTVPSAAVNGKISVTVGGKTAQSTESFTLAAPAPAITQLQPSSGTPGSQVTVTGSAFAASAGANTVRFNGRLAEVTAATASSLKVTVPPGATSGLVEVATRDGRATSASPFSVVLNSGDAQYDSTVTTSVSDPNPPSIAVTTPGHQAKVLFDAERGDDVSFGFTASTFNTSLSLRLVDPQGNQVGGIGSLSASGGDWDIRSLPLAGRYTLVVDPGPGNIGAAAVTLSRPVGGALSLTGPSSVVQVARPGQNGTWTLPGQAGQSLSVGLTVSGMTKSVTARLYGPDGTELDGTFTSVSPDTTGGISIDSLPQTGTYTLVASPADGATGTLTATGSLYADAGLLDAGGAAGQVRIDRAGQNGWARFTAQAGQRISLGAVATGFAPSYVRAEIRDPSGKPLDSLNVSANATDQWDSVGLPVSGTYLIAVKPLSATTGTLALTFSLPLNAGALTTSSTPATANVQRLGQNLEATFNGQAGDNLSLGITANTFTDYLNVSVVAPSGKKVLDRAYARSAGNSALRLQNLPETGAYQVVIDFARGATGTLSLTLSADAPFSLTTTGPSVAAGAGRAGQRMRATFTAATGDDLTLGVTGNTFTEAVTVNVIAPSGTKVVSDSWISAGRSSGLALADLPESGAYTVLVEPNQAATGTVTLTLSADARVTLTPDSASTPLTLSRPGQRIRAEFTAPSVTSLGFAVSDNSLPQMAEVRLVDSTGGNGNSLTWISTASARASYLTQLASGARYALTITPDYAAIGSLTLWLSSPVQAGQLTSSTPSAQATINRPGQQLEFTLPATQGTGMAVAFSGNTLTKGAYLTLMAPDGTLSSSPPYMGAQGTGKVSLRAPLATGTYRVLVRPDEPASGQVTATRIADVDGGTLAIGGAKQAAAIAVAGQNAHFTFAGTAGGKLTLAWDTPPSAWYLSIAGPDGAWLANEQYKGTSTLSYDLPDLAATGTYTVTVAPDGQTTGTYRLGLTQRASATGQKTATTPGPAAQRPQSAKPGKSTGAVPAGADAWQPSKDNLTGRDWITGRGAAPMAPPALWAPAAQTALTGRVLKLDGTPLANVTARIGARSVRTDVQGRFLLAGISPDAATVVVDGATANTAERQYGRFDIHIQPRPGQSTDLGFPVWMTPLDTQHTVHFDAPAKTEVVLKTPQIPGLEVRIPKGSVVRDEHGKPVTELGITPIALDRAPFPLPQHSVVPVFFTVQPGGTYVFPQGAQIIYPNYTHEPPGSRVEFMDYDPAKKGWYVYGHGQVSPDGRQVVPDSKTRVWAFHGAMFNISDLVPWDMSWLKDAIDWLSGDPVELGSGMLTDSRTDLAVADPLGGAEVSRTYWQGDTHQRAFGIGRDLSYNVLLHSEKQYQEVDLYLPGGAKIHFNRTSPGTGFSDAVFEPLDTPSAFQGSKIVNNDGHWELQFRDGTVWVFPQYALLKQIRDRHGNTLDITRLNGNKGEVTQVTTPGGGWITFAYDTQHRITSARDNTGRTTGYVYDDQGRLKTVTDPAGKPMSYTYDGTSNRIATASDARNITYLSNTYDSSGRVKHQTLTEGATYDFAYTQTGTGQITSTTVTQPGGAVRRVEFDTSGYATTDTAAYGTALARKTTFQRGPTHRVDTVTDPYGRRTALAYDAHGHVTQTTEQAGTPNARTSGTATFDGPFDQPTKITDPLGNPTLFGYFDNGDPKTVTDPENRTTAYTYTPQGQLRTVTDPANATTSYTYRYGNVETVTDSENRTARQFTDAAGRPAAVTDTAGTATAISYDALNQPRTVTDPLGQNTVLGYDDNGNLTSLTDARNNTTVWGYDNADRPKTATDPLGVQATFSYDPAGYLAKAVSRSGKTATADHDLLGRTKTVKYGVNVLGQAESTATYDYDDSLDLLKKITDTQAGNQTFTYDAYDRLKTTTGPTGAVTYDYDNADRRTLMTAGGVSTTYGYDRSSILTTLTAGTQQIIFGLDTTGREKTAALPGGFTRTTGYDTTGTIKSIAYTRAGKTIGDLTYTRDERGLQTGLTGTLANIALPAAETGTVFGKDNRITTFNGRSFTYDADGQLSNDGQRTYTWNARGQLTGLTKTGQNSAFGYSPLGDRTTKNIGGTQRNFLTDASNPAAEQNSSGATTATVTTAGLDDFLTRSENGQTQIYLTDALGTVLGLANSDGTIATKYAYDPAGQPTASGQTTTNPYTFTGREDDGTGLLYYRDRYYDSATGRFISQDPLGQAGGANLYQYALSSPTTYRDPSGNNPLIAGCVVGGLMDGGLDWLTQRLSGRKVNWGQVATAGVTGCMSGMLGEGLGMLLEAKAGARAAGSCLRNSFTADTQVLMADGTRKPIQGINVGDTVIATDPETGDSGARAVTAVIEGTGDKQLVDITVNDDAGNVRATPVTATDGHPFWSPEQHRWVPAGELQTGQWLQTGTGTWVQITAVRPHTGAGHVYNLTVDDLHTYYVLADATPVLVHNCPARASQDPGDLPDLFDPASGGYNRPPRLPGAWQDEEGTTRRVTEALAEEGFDRRSNVGSAPGTAGKMVDGPQHPGAHGPAEVVVVGAIVVVRGWQRVRRWLR
ncbi:RHS repeat-associated core domain-containing protein [Streptomyces sp. NPDC006530]|uniref:RHS repeat-associated core domain-containing protein n=1 Tax=Streptomyces sp. NPDC006530 TaxID=3364750 RepID=UPI0036BA649B